MTREEIAFGIFTGFLARDPLAAQRFTEIYARLEQLARLSFVAADVFEMARDADSADPKVAHAKAEFAWNYSARQASEVPIPKRSTDPSLPSHDLFTESLPSR